MKDPIPPNDNFAKTRLLMKANSYESFALWGETSHESDHRIPGVSPIRWVQRNPGLWFRVGSIRKEPVVLELEWNSLDGILVCFYQSPGRMVNWGLIEKALDRCFPHKPSRTDPMNFMGALRTVQANLMKEGK
jgi:hypothetical protein